MSEVMLQQSRLLCYFQIDSSVKKQTVQPIFEPQTLPMLIYHYHYPSIIYPVLYRHYHPYFDSNITQNHIRISLNDKELPSDLPMGLVLTANSKVIVTVSPIPCRSGFQMLVESWKRAYTIINQNDRCNYVNHILNKAQQRSLYDLHVKGHTHGINRIPTYEGNRIALRIYFEGSILERRQTNLSQSISDFMLKQFGQQFSTNLRSILTHGIEIDLKMSLKQLLQQWNYNDGYCYLKIMSR